MKEFVKKLKNKKKVADLEQIKKLSKPSFIKKSEPKFDLKPVQIKEFLDQYVIGQDDAKKTLSVAAYNHYKRINLPTQEDDVVVEKSNILMVGESGTGKTYLIKTLAKILDVPFCIVDATTLTQTGYTGEDVESILYRLLQASDFDIEKAEKGIVYIDEIDKIAKKRTTTSVQTIDVSGIGVQQALLKILESSIVNIKPSKKQAIDIPTEINTENILFICGGAFGGIKDIIHNRLNVSSQVGFKTATATIDDTKLLKCISTQDLMKFGLITELLGRLPIITHLDALTNESLKLILTEPRNAILKQYVRLFAIDNIKLTIEEDVITCIAEKALEFKLGARGLRAICEKIMGDLMFDIPSQKVDNYTLTRKYAEERIDMIYNIK